VGRVAVENVPLVRLQESTGTLNSLSLFSVPLEL
jgi:hypothetical protein